MKFRQDNQLAAPAGMQFAPMVDIVFLLLIFFLVTWSYARFEPELDVSVPAAEEGTEPRRQFGEIIINVHRDGRIVVHSEEVGDAELLAKLEAVAAIRANQSVILRCDEEAPSRHVLHVLDLCHKAKIYNVAFATRKREDTP